MKLKRKICLFKGIMNCSVNFFLPLLVLSVLNSSIFGQSNDKLFSRLTFYPKQQPPVSVLALLSQTHKQWQNGDALTISPCSLINDLSIFDGWKYDYFSGVAHFLCGTSSNPVNLNELLQARDHLNNAISSPCPSSYTSSIQLLLGICNGYLFQLNRTIQNYQTAMSHLNYALNAENSAQESAKFFKALLTLDYSLWRLEVSNRCNELDDLRNKLSSVLNDLPQVNNDCAGLLISLLRSSLNFVQGTLSNDTAERNEYLNACLLDSNQFQICADPAFQQVPDLFAEQIEAATCLVKLADGSIQNHTGNSLYSGRIKRFAKIGENQDNMVVLSNPVFAGLSGNYPDFFTGLQNFCSAFWQTNLPGFMNELEAARTSFSAALTNPLESNQLQEMITFFWNECLFWRQFAGGGVINIDPTPPGCSEVIHRLEIERRNLISFLNGSNNFTELRRSGPMSPLHRLITMVRIQGNYGFPSAYPTINQQLENLISTLVSAQNSSSVEWAKLKIIQIWIKWRFFGQNPCTSFLSDLNAIVASFHSNRSILHEAFLLRGKILHFCGNFEDGCNDLVSAGSWLAFAEFQGSGCPGAFAGDSVIPWMGFEWYYADRNIKPFWSGFPTIENGWSVWPPESGDLESVLNDWNMSLRGVLLSSMTNFPPSIKEWRAWIPRPVKMVLPPSSNVLSVPFFKWFNDGILLGEPTDITLTGLPDTECNITAEYSGQQHQFSTRGQQISLELPTLQEINLKIESSVCLPLFLRKTFFASETVNLADIVVFNKNIQYGKLNFDLADKRILKVTSSNDHVAYLCSQKDRAIYYLDGFDLSDQTVTGQWKNPVQIPSKNIPTDIALLRDGAVLFTDAAENGPNWDLYALHDKVNGEINKVAKVPFRPMGLHVTNEDSVFIISSDVSSFAASQPMRFASGFWDGQKIINLRDRTVETSGFISDFIKIDEPDIIGVGNYLVVSWGMINSNHGTPLPYTIQEVAKLNPESVYFLIATNEIQNAIKLIDKWGNLVRSIDIGDKALSISSALSQNRFIVATPNQFITIQFLQ